MAQEKNVGNPKRITLQYLLKEDMPVWVRNNTGSKEDDQEPGIVTLQVGAGDNIGSVVIPPGDDPVCITDQVDPHSLRSCRDLFQCIRAEGLELLDPAKAEEYYAENAERRDIVKQKIDRYIRGEKDDVNIPGEITDQGITVHPKVGDICQKAKHEIFSERDALEKLMEQSKVFSEADYQYLLSNGHYKAVKSWAKEQLFKERTKDLDPVDVADAVTK